MKRIWVAPKLIILVRGKPEEAALLLCKHHLSNFSHAPTDADGECTSLSIDQSCFTCESVEAS